jgi:hypothetical protein
LGKFEALNVVAEVKTGSTMVRVIQPGLKHGSSVLAM